MPGRMPNRIVLVLVLPGLQDKTHQKYAAVGTDFRHVRTSPQFFTPLLISEIGKIEAHMKDFETLFGTVPLTLKSV